MTPIIVSIQTPGREGRYDNFYRIECPDAHVDTLRKAVTEWAKKPRDFLIGSKQPKSPWKAKTGKEDEQVKEAVAEIASQV